MGEWIIIRSFCPQQMKVCDVFAWFQSKVGFRTWRENAVLLTRSGPFWRLLMQNPKSKTKQKLRFWRILPVLKRRILSLDNYPLKPDVLLCWKGPFLRISGDLLGVIVDGFVSKCDYIAPPRRLIRPGTMSRPAFYRGVKIHMWLHLRAIVCGRIRRLWTGVFGSGRFPGTLTSGLRWAPMVRLHCYRLPWPRRLISAQSHDSRLAARRLVSPPSK